MKSLLKIILLTQDYKFVINDALFKMCILSNFKVDFYALQQHIKEMYDFFRK